MWGVGKALYRQFAYLQAGLLWRTLLTMLFITLGCGFRMSVVLSSYALTELLLQIRAVAYDVLLLKRIMGDGLLYSVVCGLVAAAILMAHLANVACECMFSGLKWLKLGTALFCTLKWVCCSWCKGGPRLAGCMLLSIPCC